MPALIGFFSSTFGYLLNAMYEILKNYGLAIIFFTIIIKIALLPITISQQKTMKKSAKIQEKVKEIKLKYGKDIEKVNQETMLLYKQENMNPFSGCLSGIIQIIIVFGMFYLVQQPLTFMRKVDKTVIDTYKTEIQAESGNKSAYEEIEIIRTKGAEDSRVSINMNFAGLDLSKVPSQNSSDFTVYIIPILYVISSIISLKFATNTNKNKEENKPKVITQDGKPAEEEAIDQMAQVNKNMMYMMPIMSVMIAAIAPLGLALYWLVSNLLMIAEKLIINKYLEKKEETTNE